VLNDLIGGQVEAHFGLLPGMLPHIKSGKLRAIAVTTRTRVDTLPDVPTIAESGFPDYEINSWQGIFVPAGTPQDVVAKLNSSIVRIVQDPEFKALMLKEGAEPVGSSVSQFTALVSSEVTKWAKVAKESGATAD
jgi:tripartite-type tricarboxylate transporter receptor subunit TctC